MTCSGDKIQAASIGPWYRTSNWLAFRARLAKALPSLSVNSTSNTSGARDSTTVPTCPRRSFRSGRSSVTATTSKSFILVPIYTHLLKPAACQSSKVLTWPGDCPSLSLTVLGTDHVESQRRRSLERPALPCSSLRASTHPAGLPEFLADSCEQDCSTM